MGRHSGRAPRQRARAQPGAGRSQRGPSRQYEMSNRRGTIALIQILALLIGAALLEVGGLALMRQGLELRSWIVAAGGPQPPAPRAARRPGRTVFRER